MTLKEAIKWVEDVYTLEDMQTNGFDKGLKIILKKVKSLPKKEKYKEEFAGFICVDGYSSVDLQSGNFEKLLKKYNLLEEKVKIEARKGKIVIERIK